MRKKLRGYCVMRTYDVAIDDSWDNNYTANRNQHSDSGEFCWVVGLRDDYVERFADLQTMLDWCYQNGWTKPEEEDLEPTTN